MSERLILVRHGETVHNVAGIAQGWNDSALSEKGERQVHAVAQRLAALHGDALYSSSLGRALATARIIGEATGLEVRPLDDLREMSYGRWEGKSFLDVRREDADIYHRWIDDPECACPGGESHADVQRRMRNAIATATRDAKRPIIVTHGTAIRVAVTALLELPVMASRHFAQHNAALNIFVRRADRWILELWNDTTHSNALQVPEK
ncbi:MAG TPA: histidine phosphatase family protein [Thermoanaerobaculia bacterium]|jgi:broad specificity phosphatase PhoE